MAVIAPEADLYVRPYGTLYDPGMVKRVMMGIQELRVRLRERVNAAEQGEHTVFARHAKPVAVLVPIDWYRDAAKALNDPTEY
jgi:prevent-host-death family protein